MKNLLSEQAGDIRFEWGDQGASQLALAARTIIVVDIFSFTTALDAALVRRAALACLWAAPSRAPRQAHGEARGAHRGLLAHRLRPKAIRLPGPDRRQRP